MMPTATPSATTTPTPKPSPTPTAPPVSPAERDYLVRQGNSIIAQGGTGQDIAAFVDIFRGQTPEVRRGRVGGAVVETGGPTIEPSKVLGISTKAYQGLTFGFGDEFVGTLMGIMPGGRTPQEGRDLYREILAAGSGNKIVDVVAELAGGVATGATVARAAGLGAGVGSQVLGGAAGGAVAGAGAAEGNITDRAKAAAIGGVAGGIFGGALGAGMGFAGTVLRQPTRAALDHLGKIGNSLQHRLPGIGTSEDHARRLLLTTLEGELPVSEAQAKAGANVFDVLRERVLALRDAGVTPTLADAAGEETLGLASRTFASRTPVKQEVAEAYFSRQAAQGERLSENMLQTVFRSDKFGLQNAYDAVDDLSSTMRAVAAPMYRQAHREMVTVSPRMKNLILNNPRLRAAYEEGRRVAESLDLTASGQEALADGVLQIPPLPQGGLLQAAEQQLLELNVPPDRMAEMLAQLPDAFPDALPIRSIDFMQQGLRRVKERLLRGGGIETKEFIALNETLEEIMEEATTASPVFGQARRTWAGFSTARDAVEAGRGLSSKAPEIVQREIAALEGVSEGLSDFYRLGAMQDIVERIRGPISKRETADVASEIFGGRLIRGVPDDADARRIRALFDSDEAAQDFMRRVAAETRLSRTTQAVGRTGPGGRPGVEEAEQAIEGTVPSARMTTMLTALGAARQSMIQGTKKFRTRVADDVADFFSRGLDSPESLDTFIDSLEDFQMRQQMRESFGAQAKFGTSTALGAGIGRLLAN